MNTAPTRLSSNELVPPAIAKKPRQKCHGRRNLRRLRKRCRKRGMNEEAIVTFIHARNQQTSMEHVTNANDDDDVSANEHMEITIVLNDTSSHDMTLIKSHKRKQMTPSSSQRSLSQLSVQKKPMTEKQQQQQQPEEVIIAPTTKVNDRLPMYLKSSSMKLFQALRLHMKRSLRKKNEQDFIHSRLQLLDRHYRLDLNQNLWQSYLTIGSEQHLWPVSFSR